MLGNVLIKAIGLWLYDVLTFLSITQAKYESIERDEMNE